MGSLFGGQLAEAGHRVAPYCRQQKKSNNARAAQTTETGS
ncbi:ketopantoate reductase [Paraburkholderia sp. Clong3]|nr:ketopantoate reductase [Paraburkholderia sp. HC6.4b]MBB5464409.1 ketopantoate reductase [Paraburkholderia sp. CI2]MBB5502154.1 ketopantoate reductase [Paraburkholderia sp. MM5384-R2]